jgi:threonine dehydrogenase-like Zn-dependent dehydrogenase
MRAAIFDEPRSITAGDRPDPPIVEPTDAIVRVVLACVCGSDLWYYRGDSEFAPGITTACMTGGFFPMNGDGGQGEAVRVPLADSTLVTVPGSELEPR